MKASVIVIDYKRKRYILDALQSIKNQKGIDLNDIEVIVVKYYQDEKIDNYIKENFPNYKIINLDPDDPDHYIGRTFSEGIKAASNNLIFLLEDDDMFTENKISKILEVVKNIKYDEYVIWNKAILIDQTGKPLNKSRNKYAANNSSIVLNIKDKDKLINCIRKIYYAIDVAFLCYFNKNKKVIKVNEPLTYYRIHRENISRSISNREMAEMFLHDYQYIYEKTKCKGSIYGIISYKILLNLIYNANYKISLREYIECLLLFDGNYLKGLSKIILYNLFRNYLRKYYLRKYTFADLNTQNT
ncbi:MAG: glycosyltransferase [Candidatus Nanopusillus sp.]